MTRVWIEEGLRHSRERAEALRRDEGRQRHWHSLIEAQGPEVMRSLVTEVAAAVEDYRRALPSPEDTVEFDFLPQEGFIARRVDTPRVTLQCRPDYAGQTVYCSLTRPGRRPNEVVEVPFSLHFTVDASDRVGLRQGAHSFTDVAKVAEFLLSPVLFPSPGRVESGPSQPDGLDRR